MTTTLSEGDIEAIASLVTAKLAKCDNCRFKNKEAEWVHSGSKYVPSDKFPLLGKMLKLLDDAESEIGKWVIRSLFFIGIGGVLFFFLHKFGVLD
jgi:hypothetical protein